jgi:hypothetical protein
VTSKSGDSDESHEEELTPIDCDDEDAFNFTLTRQDSNLESCEMGGRPSHFAPRTRKSSKYVLKDKIGEGAYGKVYRSIDKLTNKEVNELRGLLLLYTYPVYINIRMECNLTPIIFLYSLSYSMPSRYLS